MRNESFMRVILIALCMLPATLWVQGQTPLQEMVTTEQAFSKRAEVKDAHDAFLAFIADDGLLFRPGAVNGKKWMLEHPATAPPAGKKPLLAWQPSFAGMAASGDMGFTTGPWEARADIKDDKPQGYGHFVTVWKKQADGSWKFVVDLGISHPESGGPQTLWQPARTNKKTSFKPVDIATATKALLDSDRQYSDASKQNLAKAFLAHASPAVRLYRNGNLPYIGIKAASEVLNKTTGRFTWQAINGDVSRAGDLGYTHGIYEVTDDTNKVTQHGSYVRIWKKEGSAWRIVMDVINAH